VSFDDDAPIDDGTSGDLPGAEDTGEHAPPFRPPPHPDDRLWRHPSEMAGGGSGAGGAPPGPAGRALPRTSRRGRLLAAAAGAALVVAAGGTGAALLATSGGGGNDTGGATTDQLPALRSSTTLDARARAALRAVKPSVVGVGAPTDAGGPPPGSGVVVSDDGLVLTAAALVGAATAAPEAAAGTRAYTVSAREPDEAVAAAGVVGASQRLDDRAEPIEGILAMDGGGRPGAVGGPVVDDSGTIIGITTAADDGTAYLSPATVASKVLDDLVADGVVHHAWMGIEGIDQDPPPGPSRRGDDEGRGAEIATVDPAGPAAAAGMRPADVIVEAGGRRVARMTDLLLTLRSRSPGDVVEVVIRRDGGQITLRVSLAAPPA
jgi:S1-C subfamily serine protease